MVLEIGFIGLGRMGFNMSNRILENSNIKLNVWNRSPEPVEKLKIKGAIAHNSVEELIEKLPNDKKIVWIMLPSGKVTEETFQKVLSLLNKGDIIIDGANSNFHDSIRRHKQANEKGVNMLDVGVSGGIVAKDYGYPMMIGGDEESFNLLKPLFESFGRKDGYAYLGKGGSGHYVKMIHNAIEYGMMQAIAEGFDLLENGRFENLDLHKISKIWNNGTIVESFLMKMVEKSFEKDNKLSYLKPYVAESGEGRWASIEAIESKVPFVVNSYAVNARYISQDKNSLAFRMLAAMREQFGGHEVKK